MLTRLASAIAVAIVACTSSSGSDDPLAAPPITLVEELRLDPNAEDFSVIPDIGVGPHKQVAVLQPQDGRVILFDSAGARIATIGRRGSGPGEFRFPSRAGWVADTMWVVDFQLLRTVHVGPDGAVLRTSPLPDNVRSGAPLDGDARRMRFFVPIGVHADGSVVGEVLIEPADSRDQETVFVRAPVDGPARIIWVPPARAEQWMMTVDRLSRPVPFAPTPHMDFAPDLGRFSWLTTEFTDETNGTFTLTIFGAEGDTILVRSYPFRGIAIPASVRDSVLDALNALKARQREGPPDLYDRFQAMARERMPAAYPPVTAIRLGLDGTTWLTLRDTADVRRVLVLDERGDPLGTFVLPPRSSVRRGSRTHVWMTQRDDDDLTAIARHRLVRTR